MSALVFCMILFSAVLHVIWNSLLRCSRNVNVSRLTLGCVSIAVGGVGVLNHWQVSMWVIVIALCHALVESVYFLLLMVLHRVNNFSLGYPISRALSIVFVMLLSCFRTQWRLSYAQIGLIMVIVALIIAMVMQKHVRVSSKAMTIFIGCAGVIAVYTVLGSFGVNLAATPLAYISWMYFFQGAMLMLISLVLVQRSHDVWTFKDSMIGFSVGGLSLIAFGIVLWAQSCTQPALVSALREIGIVISLPVGKILFQEKVTFTQYMLAGGIVACEILLLTI